MMTEKQAWIELRIAYEQKARGIDWPITASGLCSAIQKLQAGNEISDSTYWSMTGRLRMNRPIGALIHKVWWPTNQIGALQRVHVIDEILKTL